MAFEVIAFGWHRDTLSDNFSTATWDLDSKNKANSLLKGIADFEFIIAFLTMYQFLSHLSEITIKLQSTSWDIIKAYQEVDSVKSVYASLRKDVGGEFRKIYLQAERMARSVDVEPRKPRTCSRQRDQPNVQLDSIEEWYKVNVAIPFLDHIISELNSQFSQLAKTASQLLCLVPSIIYREQESSSDSSPTASTLDDEAGASTSSDHASGDGSSDPESQSDPDDSNQVSVSSINLSKLIKLYEGDLPSPELFSQEFFSWKLKYRKCKSRPNTCARALKECDKASYPNIFVLLQIACTIPVTSCECERNASALRQLHNFMRTSMTEDRLTSLALMHIHYDHPVDLDNVVDKFAELHPRRLKFTSVLFNDH